MFDLRKQSNEPAYLMVRNNPVDNHDVRGLFNPGLAVVAAVVACAYPQFLASEERYGEDSDNKKGDKFQHCWVSCRVAKTCGGAIAQLAGLGKEARDRAVAAYCEKFPEHGICKGGGHADFWDSLNDIQANQECIGWETSGGALPGWIGSIFRESCECCCSKKFK